MWSAVITGILAVVGGVIGYLVAGPDGPGERARRRARSPALFLGMTALIILIAGRLPTGAACRSRRSSAIVLGGWILKLVVFIVALLVLRGQPWIEPFVFFFACLVSVIASLVVDLVVMARARVPYVGDVELPTSSDPLRERTGGS